MADLIDVEIQQETLIRATPEAVYDAIATPEGLDAWFTTAAEVDAREDGEMAWRWKDWGPSKVTTETCGPVLKAERGKRLIFQWNKPPTTVDITFVVHEQGTVVKLREYGYPNTPQGRRDLLECACGWGEAITLLKFYWSMGLFIESD